MPDDSAGAVNNPADIANNPASTTDDRVVALNNPAGITNDPKVSTFVPQVSTVFPLMRMA
jgi:hypothetical protein